MSIADLMHYDDIRRRGTEVVRTGVNQGSLYQDAIMSNDRGELGLGAGLGNMLSPTAVAMHTVADDDLSPLYSMLFDSYGASPEAVGAMRVAAGDGFSIIVCDAGHVVAGVGRGDSGQLGACDARPGVPSSCPLSINEGPWSAVNDACADKDPLCPQRELDGDCEFSSSRFGYMVLNCQLTCGLCETAPPVAQLVAGAAGSSAQVYIWGGLVVGALALLAIAGWMYLS